MNLSRIKKRIEEIEVLLELLETSKGIQLLDRIQDELDNLLMESFCFKKDYEIDTYLDIYDQLDNWFINLLINL